MSLFCEVLTPLYDAALAAEARRRGLPVAHLSTLRLQVVGPSVIYNQTFAPDTVRPSFSEMAQAFLLASAGEEETVELVLRSHIGDEVIGRWPVRLEGGVPELLSDAKPTPTWW
jgi:hypothetical protein